MSTVVLYCWCHSDKASVLLYFTFKARRSRINHARKCRLSKVNSNVIKTANAMIKSLFKSIGINDIESLLYVWINGGICTQTMVKVCIMQFNDTLIHIAICLGDLFFIASTDTRWVVFLNETPTPAYR